MTEPKVRAQYDQLATQYDQRWSRYVSNTLSFFEIHQATKVRFGLVWGLMVATANYNR